MKTHSKIEIATAQLRSAVMLFCSGQDRISAITLAGAADVILCQLLLNEDKENFTDLLIKAEAEKTGSVLTRSTQGRAVNDMLMINALKHMDRHDDDYLEMNVLICALATVGKAVANYVSLCGDGPDFVRVFKMWAQIFVPKGVDDDGVPVQD